MSAHKYCPSAEDRKKVESMSALGIRQADIAFFMGINERTLRRHYKDDIRRGVIAASLKVNETLFNLATREKNVASLIFWCKTREGWRETGNLDVNMKGAASPVMIVPAQMDEDDWSAYAKSGYKKADG